MIDGMTKYLIAMLIILATAVLPNARTQAPVDQSNVAFDVVSIRHSPKDGGAIYMNLLPSGLYTARNMTVEGLIKDAYGYGLEFVGAPDWISTARFDISAKTDVAKPATQGRQLFKALLGDRFKLRVHFETRERPIYALVMARSDGRFGPFFRRAQDCDPKAPQQALRTGPATGDQLPTCGMMFNMTRQAVGNATLAALIQNLPRSTVNRPVLDRTGLTGRFDWDLQWENDQTGASSGVSIFSALQEQLGLKLEPGRGPVEVLVIDHVEMPTVE
jgi:uncharacterized protein (TIGR03435 family)